MPIAKSIPERLRYDADTGTLYWRADGTKATHPNSRGYNVVKVGRKTHLASRVVFFLHFGVWPKGQLRHTDGDTRNDRVENLIEYNGRGEPRPRPSFSTPTEPRQPKDTTWKPINKTKTTSALVRERYTYDGRDIRWKIDYLHMRAGDEAGTFAGKQHFITVRNERIPTGRVAFFLHYGYWPKRIEYVNGNALDIRIKNLREGTASTPEGKGKHKARPKYQSLIPPIAKRTKTGAMAVQEKPDTAVRETLEGYKKPRRYEAVLHIKGERIHCGYYPTSEEAKRVADKAKAKHIAEQN